MPNLSLNVNVSLMAISICVRTWVLALELMARATTNNYQMLIRAHILLVIAVITYQMPLR